MTDKLAPRNGLLSMVEKQQDSIIAHLPKHITPERMMRVIRTAIQTTPALWNCTPNSVMESLVDASQLGLEPNGPLGDSALVPFRNNKTKTMECQLMVMYRGYIELADRTGKVSFMDAQIVRDGDVFEFEYGTDAKLRHVPKMGAAKQKEPAGVEAVYALVKFKDGQSKFVVLSVEEIEEIRACSRAKSGPAWTQWWGEMAKKTALRRLIKYVRLSPELSRAAYLDEALDAGVRPGQSLDQADRVRDASDSNTESLMERLEQAAAPDDDTIDTTAEVVEDDGGAVAINLPGFDEPEPNESDLPDEFDPWDHTVFGAESKFTEKVSEVQSEFFDLAVDGLGLSANEALAKWKQKVMKIIGAEGASTMSELDQKQKNATVKALAAAVKDFRAVLDERQ